MRQTFTKKKCLPKKLCHPTLKLVLELLSRDFVNLRKWVFHNVTRHYTKTTNSRINWRADLVKTLLSVFNFATLMKLSCVKTA